MATEINEADVQLKYKGNNEKQFQYHANQIASLEQAIKGIVKDDIVDSIALMEDVKSLRESVEALQKKVDSFMPKPETVKPDNYKNKKKV